MRRQLTISLWIAGGSAFGGVPLLGFGPDRPLVRRDVPLGHGRVRSFLGAIGPIMGSSLITLEKVQVLRYGVPDRAGHDAARSTPPDVGGDVNERR